MHNLKTKHDIAVTLPDRKVRFETAPYPVETEPSIFAKRRSVYGETRESLRVTVYAQAADISAVFQDGVRWAVEETVMPDDGTVTDAGVDADTYKKTTSYDKSDYCICGDIVDHRDGRVSFYMAKHTGAELALLEMEAENARLLYENLTGGAY